MSQFRKQRESLGDALPGPQGACARGRPRPSCSPSSALRSKPGQEGDVGPQFCASSHCSAPGPLGALLSLLLMWDLWFTGTQLGFSGGLAVLQHRNPRFDPQVRRAWQPTPVFLPGESHGQRSLAGYRSWGRKESDTTGVPWHPRGHSGITLIRVRHHAVHCSSSWLPGPDSSGILGVKTTIKQSGLQMFSGPVTR